MDDDSRAMARMLKEANRVKNILSANVEVMASLENVIEGIDFRHRVTRKQLESMCADIIKSSVAPLDTVLSKSKLTLDAINSLVLVGGGVRVPSIQAKLISRVTENKIARNIDGDEAAVLGAVLHAAAVSAQFQLGVKNRIKDLNMHPIQITYTVHSEKAKTRDIKTVLFTDVSVLGSKKLMTFKKTTDFTFTMEYVLASGVAPIASVQVIGLEAALAKFKTTIQDDPKVRMQIRLTESGILQIDDFHVVLNLDTPKPEKKKPVLDSLMDFLGSKKKGDKVNLILIVGGG